VGGGLPGMAVNYQAVAALPVGATAPTGGCSSVDLSAQILDAYQNRIVTNCDETTDNACAQTSPASVIVPGFMVLPAQCARSAHRP
jgi:hypothetical protein